MTIIQSIIININTYRFWPEVKLSFVWYIYAENGCVKCNDKNELALYALLRIFIYLNLLSLSRWLFQRWWRIQTTIRLEYYIFSCIIFYKDHFEPVNYKQILSCALERSSLALQSLFPISESGNKRDADDLPVRAAAHNR